MDRLAIHKGIPMLDAIVGPMYSGKSQEINRRLTYIDHYNQSRQNFYDGSGMISYIIIRPDTDTRSSEVRAVPWWFSNLKIWHCHCCGCSNYCGTGSYPWPRNFSMSQMKKQTNKTGIWNSSFRSSPWV